MSEGRGKITAAEVRYVADLARLELTGEEVGLFTAQLNSILLYMEELGKIDTGGVEPTSHVLPLRNVLREDEAGLSLPLREALANAPEQDRDHFVVPKIIE